MSYNATEPIDSDTFTPPKVNIPSPAITSRGITAATLAKYHVYATGTPGQIRCNYYAHDSLALVGCKFRKRGWSADSVKEVVWLPGSKRSMFGWHLLTSSYYDKLYLCEGETDAMALSQAVSYPVLALGGNPSYEVLAKWGHLLRSKCTTLVLCFDADEAGAKHEAALLKCYGSTNLMALRWDSPHKDIAEVLLNQCSYTEVQIPELPPTLLNGAQLIAAIENPDVGVFAPSLSTGYAGIDKLIDGYRPGKMILVAGEEKQGKTSFVLSLVAKYIELHRQPVLLVPLEMSATDNLMAIAQSMLGLSNSDRVSHREAILSKCHEMSSYVFAMKHFGFITEDDMARHLQFIPQLGVRLVVLDHITASATSFSDGLDVRTLDAQLYQLQSMLIEYGCAAIVVSHVNSKVEGRVKPKDLRGSKALGQVPEVVLGVNRVEMGLTDVYTVTPDRHVGSHGTVHFEYANGAYTEIRCRLNEVL